MLKRILFSLLSCLLILNITQSHAQPVPGSLLPVLQSLRPQYPTPMSPVQIGQLLTRTAQSTAGWGLLKKETGTTCPAMSVTVSCDYLVYALTGQGYDVLQDAEGQGIPQWNPGDTFPLSRFVAVGDVAPVPPPTPVPPSVDLSSVHLKLDAIIVKVDAVKADTGSIRSSLSNTLKFLSKYVVPALGAWIVGKKV